MINVQKGVRTVYLNDHGDYFAGNQVVFLMEHRFPAIEYAELEGCGLPARLFAAQQVVDRRAIADAEVDLPKLVCEHLAAKLDHLLAGGGFKPTELTRWELLPRIAKAQRLLKRVRAKLLLSRKHKT